MIMESDNFFLYFEGILAIKDSVEGGSCTYYKFNHHIILTFSIPFSALRLCSEWSFLTVIFTSIFRRTFKLGDNTFVIE